MRDYGSLLRQVRAGESGLVVQPVGPLHVSTGRLVCCDPLTGLDSSALIERQVPIGQFPFEVWQADLGGWGMRPAFAVLRVAEAVPVRWEEAGSFSVDTGLACIGDAWTIERAAVADAAHVAADPERNGEGRLLPLLEASDTAAGVLLSLPETGTGNLAICTSGIGDGVFDVVWGLGEDGTPALLLVDFAVIEPCD